MSHNIPIHVQLHLVLLEIKKDPVAGRTTLDLESKLRGGRCSDFRLDHHVLHGVEAGSGKPLVCRLVINDPSQGLARRSHQARDGRPSFQDKVVPPASFQGLEM